MTFFTFCQEERRIFMDRIILHSDLNNFFASVECAENPEYRDKFIAVCGKEDDRHGIVLAKNQRAKLCGVKTGDTIREAKLKCPELLCVLPHFEKYSELSKRVRKIYCDYTDEVEAFGMDECWLDVTRSTLLFGSGRTIAEEIRERVKRETGLTVSVGVSFNKVFAKLGSDMKKPDAVTEIGRGDFREKIWPLPAAALLGVGRSSEKVLSRHGIHTIGDIAAVPREYMEKWLGKCGASLHDFASGNDFSRVAPAKYVPVAQSVSRGVTCRAPLNDCDEVSRIVLYLSEHVSTELRRTKCVALGIGVTVKDESLRSVDFTTRLSRPTRSHRLIFEGVMTLFRENYIWRESVRALTVRTFELQSDTEPIVLDFFTDAVKEEKYERKEACADSIRSRFGKNSVFPASLIGDIKLPSILNKSRLPGSPFR